MIVDLVTLFASEDETDIDKILQLSLNRSAPHTNGSFHFSKIKGFFAVTKEQGE